MTRLAAARPLHACQAKITLRDFTSSHLGVSYSAPLHLRNPTWLGVYYAVARCLLDLQFHQHDYASTRVRCTLRWDDIFRPLQPELSR